MSTTWMPAHRLLVGDRTPTAGEGETIDRVHQLCRSWASQGMPLAIVRQESTGHERWTATRFTSPEHRMFRPLMAMLDALIASDQTGEYGYQYGTPQGYYSTADLRSVDARISKADDGRIRILFPIAYPWTRRPDPERGEPGVPDQPVYAETFEDRMEIANTKRIHERPARRTFA